MNAHGLIVGLAIGFVASNVGAYTRSFTLADGADDLTKAASYSAVAGGTVGVDVPSVATDEILLPAGRTFTLLPDTANWSLANSIGRFRALDDSAELCVDVESGEETLTCGFNSTGTGGYVGTFRKAGAGELKFEGRMDAETGCTGESSYHFSCAKFILEDGTFAPSKLERFYDIDIAEDGVFIVPDAYTGLTMERVNLKGQIVSRSSTSAVYHQCSVRTYGVFDGSFGGALTLDVQNGGYLELSGKTNPFNYDCIINGTGSSGVSTMAARALGIRNGGYWLFGQRPGPDFYAARDTRFLYLGEGETSNVSFGLFEVGPARVIDGGPNGGLALVYQNNQGYFNSYSGYKGVKHLVLQGEGLADCVIDSSYQWREIRAADANCPFFVEKRGEGAWRMTGGPSLDYALRGPVRVSAGTLRFDSLHERGRRSALGTAELLYAQNAAFPFSDAGRQDWALMIGGTNENCTLEYTGSSGVMNGTRPLAVTGKFARFNNAGTAPFHNGGVGVKGTDPVTLILDGDGDFENRFSNVTNTPGAGALTVVKRGSGTYALEGNSTFDGDLKVESGTLIVRGTETPAHRYFRFSVCETANTSEKWQATAHAADANVPYLSSANSATANVHFDSIALYDAAGVRQNVLIKGSNADYEKSYKSVTLIQPGEIAFGRTDPVASTGTYDKRSSLGGLVSENGGFDGWGTYTFFNKDLTGGSFEPLTRANPNSWVSFVMRLTNGTPEIVRYDVGGTMGHATAQFYRAPTSFRIESSHDGLNWTLLDDRVAVDPPSGVRWYSSPEETYSRKAVRANAGFAFQTRAAGEVSVLPNVKAVSVAPGAKLVAENAKPTIRALSVSADGMGTISNFTFAATGTLSVDNWPTGEKNVFIPASLAGAENLDNLSDWQVAVDGAAKRGYSITATTEGIGVSAPGLAIIVR